MPFLEKLDNVLEIKQINSKDPEPQKCIYDSVIIANISKEIFNIGILILGFTIGTLFSSSSNIVQTEIAASRDLEFSIFYSTLFTWENLLVSAGTFFVFKIKFLKIYKRYQE